MPDQLPLPFAVDQKELTAFLDQHIALEDEIDRLKQELVICKGLYEDALPMRAVLVAVKVTRARRKLVEHPKEPLSLQHQAYLEDLIAQHIDEHEAAVAKMAEEAARETGKVGG